MLKHPKLESLSLVAESRGEETKCVKRYLNKSVIKSRKKCKKVCERKFSALWHDGNR